MNPKLQNQIQITTIVKWLARLGSIASLIIIGLFAFGGQESMKFLNLNETIGFAFFPVGVLVGMLIGWKYELIGGLFSILCLIGFYAWHYSTAGTFPTGPWFLIFTLPAVLFIVSGTLASLDREN